MGFYLLSPLAISSLQLFKPSKFVLSIHPIIVNLTRIMRIFQSIRVSRGAFYLPFLNGSIF